MSGLHVAIIMDGNGRWARAQGRPRWRGHVAGVDSVRDVVRAAPDLGVRVLTLYAFSSGGIASASGMNWWPTASVSRRLADGIAYQLRRFVRWSNSRATRRKEPSFTCDSPSITAAAQRSLRPFARWPSRWPRVDWLPPRLRSNGSTTSSPGVSPCPISSSGPPARGASPISCFGRLHTPSSIFPPRLGRLFAASI